MASLVPDFEYDVFISYRQKDNKYDGWVTEFVDNLKKELDATFKEEISVYFDINPHEGLLETHDVNASLKNKLKCLVFIPLISRTYCDPKSFAWEHEFVDFINQARHDRFGLRVNLPGGNVTNRVLPVRIHDLDPADIKLCESVIGGFLRPVDFVYKETGVNRQLRAKDDDIIKSPGQILYRDQINKVSLAIREIIESLRTSSAQATLTEREKHDLKEQTRPLTDDAPGEEKRKVYNKEKTDTRISGKSGKRIPISGKVKVGVTGIILTAIVISLILIYNHHSNVRWAREKALPQIEKYYNELNLPAAFDLIRKAGKYISKDPEFKDWVNRTTKKVTILTDPPGADVNIREYSDINGEWEKIGRTPVDSIRLPQFSEFGYDALPFSSIYQVRLEKEGYEKVLASTITILDTLKRKLFKEGTIPSGMVYVEGTWDEDKKLCSCENGFFIDRFEVTNKQFKKFVDEGGYRNRQFWKHEFIKGEKVLTWEQSMAEFTDKTGRSGPSTWEAGDYPTGQDDYPVGGISWYEAAAYAAFAGKSLPTYDHWLSAAGFCYPAYFAFTREKMFRLSNFNGKSPDPVGQNKGVSFFGEFDMAGNLREWCWNKTDIGHIFAGAGYDDANYLNGAPNQLPSFDRSPQNGFRCITLINDENVPDSVFREIKTPRGGRDFSKEIPVPEHIFQVYRNQFQYDNTPLNAKIEERDEKPDKWIVEKVSFDVPYAGERMVAYLYLPKNSFPPYQTLIFFPGSYAVNSYDIKDNNVADSFFDYILKSGRAVLFPIYLGTYNRRKGAPELIDMPNQSYQYTEWLIKCVKEFRRSIDYLGTRGDIDTARIGYYAHSWGCDFTIIPAVEKRLKVSIYVLGGFWDTAKAFPEADAFNYVSRVKIPTLMLNGRYDNVVPFDLCALPLYNLLGTPVSDKKLCIYETCHNIPKIEMTREVLNWLDKYLGTVK